MCCFKRLYLCITANSFMFLCTTTTPFMYVLSKYVDIIMSIFHIQLNSDGLSTCMSVTWSLLQEHCYSRNQHCTLYYFVYQAICNIMRICICLQWKSEKSVWPTHTCVISNDIYQAIRKISCRGRVQISFNVLFDEVLMSWRKLWILLWLTKLSIVTIYVVYFNLLHFGLYKIRYTKLIHDWCLHPINMRYKYFIQDQYLSEHVYWISSTA